MKFDLHRLHSALAARSQPSANPTHAAAVAAILRHGTQGSEALLIRRSRHEHDPWSGHMAFPGGKRHAADTDLLSTAVREAQEEVGLALDRQATLLGALDPLEAVAHGLRVGFTITPFVFLLHEPCELTLDPGEVEEALWAPLEPLSRGEQHTTHATQRGGLRYDLPAFDVQGRVVWGLTHRMLVNLLEVGRSP